MRRKKRKMISPDLTPLIDIVFLLLVFFMIVSNFDQYGNIELELPHSGVISQEKETKSFEIILDKNKRYFIKENDVIREIKIEELEENLLNQDEIVVTADKELSYESVMELLGKIERISNKSITLSAFQ
ncbi:MAG: ExbD/TolR family protein [Fusobacteriaceae bacterium]